MRFFNFTNHQTGQETALKRIRSKSCRSSPKWHNKKNTCYGDVSCDFSRFFHENDLLFFCQGFQWFYHPRRMIFRSKKTNKNIPFLQDASVQNSWPKSFGAVQFHSCLEDGYGNLRVPPQCRRNKALLRDF